MSEEVVRFPNPHFIVTFKSVGESDYRRSQRGVVVDYFGLSRTQILKKRKHQHVRLTGNPNVYLSMVRDALLKKNPVKKGTLQCIVH